MGDEKSVARETSGSTSWTKLAAAQDKFTASNEGKNVAEQRHNCPTNTERRRHMYEITLRPGSLSEPNKTESN